MRQNPSTKSYTKKRRKSIAVTIMNNKGNKLVELTTQNTIININFMFRIADIDCHSGIVDSLHDMDCAAFV